MFEAADRGVWDKGHQRLHTLYWSTFLGLPSGYDTTRFRDRYHPATSVLAADELLAHWKSGASPRVLRSFQKLALWTLAPHFFGGAGPRYSGDDGAAFDRTAQAVRDAFKARFGFDVAADRGWDDRKLVPELPELEFEGAAIETRARQRSMRAHVDAVVTLPYARLRSIVHPWRWACSPFWSTVPASGSLTDGSLRETVSAAVRLPGGWWPDANKVRPIELEVDLADSPFETRLDYQAKEVPQPDEPTGRPRRRANPETAVQQSTGKADDDEAPRMELGRIVGFFLVEKMPGRPGACRIVAEREATFFDFNHEHFCAETLSYWLASELLALVEEAKNA